MIEIRKTTAADLDEVMRIYDNARKYMRAGGNTVQWTNGYPDRDIISDDIRNGCSYVCLNDGQLAGVFSLVPGEDPTYQAIHGGSWLNDNPYGTVHRIAVAVHNKGIAQTCLAWCYEKFGNLRIDTHEDNMPMRSLVRKCGFQYCGVIYLPDGSPRLAFQKCGG